MTDETILPCPFCGGAVKYYNEGSSDAFDCQGECRASVVFWIKGGDEPRAKAAWNRLAAPDASERERLAQISARITQYLSVGGLFNPESMEHPKVRDLLMDCRVVADAILAAGFRAPGDCPQCQAVQDELRAHAARIGAPRDGASTT